MSVFKGSFSRWVSVLWCIHAFIPAYANTISKFNFFEKDESVSYACSAIDSIQPELRKSYVQLINADKNACLISAYRAFKQTHEPKSLLIDTRSAKQFNQQSIPGSLNIPLHALKTKAFLNNKTLFLINDGTNSIGLNQVCHDLRDKGIQTHVVLGGLNSWAIIDNTFKTSVDAFSSIDQMSPQDAYYELLLSDNILISISNNSEGIEPLFRHKTHILADSNNANELAIQIQNLLKRKPNIKRLFIYSIDGYISPTLKMHLREKFREPIFYLTGGELAYKQYRKNHLAMLKRLKHPSGTLYRCRG